MSSKRTRLVRLLDRGFYPVELPPVFATRNYSSAANSILANLSNQRTKHYSVMLNFDGSTYQGNLRTFGIINPVNFCILSDFIAAQWSNLQKVYKLSSSSGSRPVFPNKSASGRAIHTASLATKRQNLKHMAGSFPKVLTLDINRFYGTIYTHSIPWASLGKNEAKKRFHNHSLKSHWSDELDTLTRNCNSKQTVGIPIGPDTSRIISELILSRVDYDMVKNHSEIIPSAFFHNIDDYQFGIFRIEEAELAQSKFVWAIQRMELRLNDYKTRLDSGLDFAPSNWQRSFDFVSSLSGTRAVEAFFDQLYKCMSDHPNSNVVGYSLKKFGGQLASNARRELVLEYLQRLIFAAPHNARWIFPIYLGICERFSSIEVNQKRAVRWGADVCVRRADIGSLLWFLYAAFYLNIKFGKELSERCFALGNPLIDLMLIDGKQRGLISISLSEFRQRYRDSDFMSRDAILLYEVEKRGWDTSKTFCKIGTQKDAFDCFSSFLSHGVDFYRPEKSSFQVSAFPGWNLRDDDFEESSETKAWSDFASLFEKLEQEIYE